MKSRKDKLFQRLASFLRANVNLVADFRDSDAPWNLLSELEDYEEDLKGKK
jgi:hypothetical protein